MASVVLLSLLVGGALWSRSLGVSSQPQTCLYLDICGTLLSFFYTANALMRFRTTHDRTTLLIAAGFALAGVLEMAGSFGVAERIAADSPIASQVPASWLAGGTLLGLFFLVAIATERWMPASRQPGREIAAVLLLVGVAGYLASAISPVAPAAPAQSASLFVHPVELIPAALFLGASFLCLRRLRRSARAYDYALFAVALLNAGSHASAGFSLGFFDGPFFVAETCKTLSYGVMLIGAMLEQERLFEQAQAQAICDSLTGLANYRRLLSVLPAELDRARRSEKPFSVVLLDMDGLKAINDEFGHLTGSRALVRLGSVLRMNSRAIDTAARYGGDEFALVLPEAGLEIATRVVERIRERLQRDGEMPRLSVSAGIAIFPQDGATPDELLAAADRSLYGMKNRRSAAGHLQSIARIAACL
ncbi:MAG: GGDEF domain-containing protein [Acidobacteriia bacterium]|nr:GGDEF domain-containing protein [Terriglobia bacterium]